MFLSKNVDNLTTENIELKKKLENEKVTKQLSVFLFSMIIDSKFEKLIQSLFVDS